jgi:Rrf2 family protein
MRISAKAEYACIAMLELAANRFSQPVRIKSIAANHGIPQRFLVQILLQLKGAGLVTSVRGAAGGYQLLKPPEEITLADIINQIDGTPSLRQTPFDSPRFPVIQALRQVWKDLQAEEQRILEEINLADLVRRTQDSAALSYQI